MTCKALVVTIDEDVCDWLYSQLKDRRKSEAVKDLLEGISGLRQKEYSSLIINTQPSEKIDEEYIDRISYGNLIIDGGNRSVSYGERLIQLTPKEFDILYLLANNKGRVYSKHQIYENVWKEQYGYDDSNIMAHIRKLRKKLEPHPEKPMFIQTVWGVGYKFDEI